MSRMMPFKIIPKNGMLKLRMARYYNSDRKV
nr:MAG TPA_asm: hypothetical protein [Bacteriophage sp.]